MAEPKLHQILIGIVAVCIFVTGLIMFMTDGVTKYGANGFDDTNFVKINKSFQDINEISNKTNAKLQSLQSSTGIGATLDAFFTQGYSAIKISAKSVDIFGQMSDAGLSNLPLLGSFGQMLKSYLWVIILIFITIGLFLAFIIKSGRE